MHVSVCVVWCACKRRLPYGQQHSAPKKKAGSFFSRFLSNNFFFGKFTKPKYPLTGSPCPPHPQPPPRPRADARARPVVPGVAGVAAAVGAARNPNSLEQKPSSCPLPPCILACFRPPPTHRTPLHPPTHRLHHLHKAWSDTCGHRSSFNVALNDRLSKKPRHLYPPRKPLQNSAPTTEPLHVPPHPRPASRKEI